MCKIVSDCQYHNLNLLVLHGGRTDNSVTEGEGVGWRMRGLRDFTLKRQLKKKMRLSNGGKKLAPRASDEHIPSTEQIFDWAKFRADSGVFDRRKKVFSRQKKRKKK